MFALTSLLACICLPHHYTTLPLSAASSQIILLHAVVGPGELLFLDEVLDHAEGDMVHQHRLLRLAIVPNELQLVRLDALAVGGLLHDDVAAELGVLGVGGGQEVLDRISQCVVATRIDINDAVVEFLLARDS